MSVLSKIRVLSEPINSECLVCKFVCRDQVDFISLLEDGCCTECRTNFKHIMGEDWEKGLRPKVSTARRKMGFDQHN